MTLTPFAFPESANEIRIISMREAEKHEIKEFFSYL